MTTNEGVQPTKGPWEVVSSGFRVMSKPSEGFGVYVCDTANNKVTRTPENAANARLIAAAPELLEALDAIVTSAHNGNEPGQTWIMVAGGLIDSAEAAIRKAKGEQQ